MICIVVDEENVGVVFGTDTHKAISIECYRTSLICSVVHKTEGTRNSESAVYSSDGCSLVSKSTINQFNSSRSENPYSTACSSIVGYSRKKHY